MHIKFFFKIINKPQSAQAFVQGNNKHYNSDKGHSTTNKFGFPFYILKEYYLIPFTKLEALLSVNHSDNQI